MRRHNGQPPNAACLFPPRRTEGLSNRIPFSFVSPALVVLRLLFSVCSPSPQKARPLACPSGKIACSRRKESWCAEERQKARRIPAFRRKDTFLPFAERRGSAVRSRTRIWRAKAPTAICRLESSSGNPRIRNASTPETLASTTSKTMPRCLTFKRSSPPGRFHWEPLRRRASPQDSAPPPGPRPRCRDRHHDAGAGLAVTSALWPRPGLRFYAAPPYAAQRYTAANPQTLYSFARSENHHGFHTVANS